MESSRWWHVAVLGTATVLAALVVWGQSNTGELMGGLASLTAFVLAWLLVGRHAVTSQRAATTFVVITIVVAGVGAAFSPSIATIQCIAYPIIWVLCRGLRQAVLANVALAGAVGLGLYISTSSLVQSLLVQLISASFSLALGLWISSIANRSTERQRLLDELHSTQHQLAEVSRDAGVFSERERLAREIHDTIAQDLTGLVLITQRARRELAAGDTAAVNERLLLLEEHARDALAETRALVAATAPVGLARGGLLDALDRLGARFEREAGVRVSVSASGLPPLDRDTEVVLLRCAQEGLANVRKHSGAVTASVLIVTKPGGVTLEVRDDGHGFDTERPTGGFGLGGMRDRLALVGGSLQVTSDTSGTSLTATLPAPA